jgi:hypothetical protein
MGEKRGMAIPADAPRAFSNGDARRRKLDEDKPKQKRPGRARASTTGVPNKYRMLSTGLWWFPTKELAELAEEAEHDGRLIMGGTWLASEFEVVAMVRDGDSGDWACCCVGAISTSESISGQCRLGHCAARSTKSGVTCSPAGCRCRLRHPTGTCSPLTFLGSPCERGAACRPRRMASRALQPGVCHDGPGFRRGAQ